MLSFLRFSSPRAAFRYAIDATMDIAARRRLIAAIYAGETPIFRADSAIEPPYFHCAAAAAIFCQVFLRR